MKRITLILWLLLSTTIWTFAYDFKFGDLYYNITSYSTAEVTYSYYGLSSAIIPESVTYNGITYNVTSIGEEAFFNCTGLTSITIPNSVTSIGDYAFYECSGLTSVTIGNSVTSIGESAFSDCRGLTSVTIPNSVTSIGDYAFYECSGLTSVTIGNSVTSIGESAFSDCRGLTSVTIPSSVTSIGDYAFSGCSGLTSITIPNSVTSIGNWAFEDCSNLVSISISNSVTYIGADAFSGTPWLDGQQNGVLYIGNILYEYKGKMPQGTKIIVKEGTICICGGAFESCSGLASITIPNSVTSIGSRAFDGCSGLTSITIPSSITSIGASAFNDCSGLTKTNYTGDIAGWYNINFGTNTNPIDYSRNFFINDTLLTDLVIPEGIDTINDLFRYDTCLISVTIPNSVTSIGNGAFNGMSNLTSVIWNAKHCADFGLSTPFRYYEYRDSPANSSIASQITSFVFGDGVQHIPACICDGMSNLTSITIPNNITSIGVSAFNGCSGLTSVQWNAGNCADFTNDDTPFYHKGSYYDSEDDFDLRSQITSFVFGNGVQHIPACICDGMSNLTSMTIPNNITSVGEYAFDGCSGLTSIEWNAKNCADFTSSSTPFNKNAITSFAFGDSVQHIPAYICNGMNNLTSITIPSSVTSVGEYAFDGCTGLNKTNYTGDIAGWLNITGWGYTLIGGTIRPIIYSRNFFINDVLVTDLVIPEGIDIINDAFSYDTCLISVTIPNSVTSIGWSAFMGCSSLTSVTIGNSVTSIDWNAFYLCSGLTSVVWNAKNYTDFSSEGSSSAPFYYSGAQITSFIFGDSVQHIPAYICNGMNNLTSVTIGNSVTSIGESAFSGCRGLTSVVWNAKNYADFTNNATPFYSKRYPYDYSEDDFDLRSQITSFVFGDSVQHIPAWLCAGMNNLTSITIPNSVTSIGESAFSGCSGLTAITIPNSVDHIGANAFGNCNDLTSVVWKAKKCIGWNNYKYSPFYSEDGNNITSFTFGKEVESIPNYLCYEMKNLTSVVIPNSVDSIGEEAFRNCRALISVAMGKNVTYIGYRAFDGTYWLNNQRDGLIYMKTILYGYKGEMPKGTNIVVREGTTAIGYNALAGYHNLASVTLPTSVTNIQDSAFYDCRGLDSITIPNGVAAIGQYAFANCSNLTSIVWNAKHCGGWNNSRSPFNDAQSSIMSFTFGDEVGSIPAYLCYGMNRIDSITIPASVTSIGNSAFEYCSRLTKTNYTGDVAGWYRIKFGDGSANPINNSRNLFLNNVLVTDLIVPSDLDTINDAFGRDTCLISVVIPDGVKVIGETAFYDCTRLTDVSISNSVTSIGERAFQNCNRLTSFAIPNSVTSIGGGAFSGCSGLTSITIPNSVTSIGSGTFLGCSGLTSVTIPNSVTTIGEYAFYECSGLTSVTIGNSVTSVGDEAFRNCAGLTYVTCYATEPPSVSSNAFYGVKVDSIPLYVPMESIAKYNSSDVWRDFLVLPISAMPVETDDPVFYPEETKVTIVWPAVEDAISYTIEISKDSATVCTLLFDAGGVLQNMRYTTLARCAAQHAKQAETIGDGFRFVVEGLDYATTYTYTITATDMDDAVLATYTGTFTTTDPDPATATKDIHSTQSQPETRKVFRNGQVHIIRGDKTYTLTGEEVK